MGRDAGGCILKRGAMSLPHSWHTSGGIWWQDLWVLETQNCLHWDGKAQPNSEPEVCQADPIAGTNAARIVLFSPVEARSPPASWKPGVDAAPTAGHEVLFPLQRAGEGVGSPASASPREARAAGTWPNCAVALPPTAW